jgi:hypothetical protein
MYTTMLGSLSGIACDSPGASVLSVTNTFSFLILSTLEAAKATGIATMHNAATAVGIRMFI